MISVIIPVYNEEVLIGRCLDRLRQQEGDFEILVADGRSQDRTVSIAQRDAPVVRAEKGRANQMNAGAQKAQGETLLFLHADAWLEGGSLLEIEKSMKDNRVVGGCLTQRIEAGHPFYRLLELSGTIRARLSHLFYGDQALFVRKAIFDRLEGYAPLPLFEDVAFSQKLRGSGKTVILPKRIFTSARRWETNGMLRGSLRSGALFFLYGLGIAPEKLVRFYPDVR